MSQDVGRRDFLRAAFGSIGFWALAGCGGGDSTTPESSAAAAGLAANTSGAMFPLASALANIRARPETFLSSYGALGGTTSSNAHVRSQLGTPFASLNDAGSMSVFASAVAFASAAQGNNSIDPLTATMRQILSSAQLACGHFCKLTTLLTLLGHPGLIPPDATPGGSPKPTLHFLVWYENVPMPTGVHSQLILANVLENAYLLLDPMYGYAVRIPFVGAGPQADLTVIENAATMLQTPVGQSNLALLDPAGTAGLSQMVQVVIGGGLGPQYIYHDVLYGSEAWDNQIGQVFNSMGATNAPALYRPLPH